MLFRSPAAGKAKAYPYVLALHCQWEQEAAPSSWVMDDSGEWTAVGAPDDGALLVTIGDIAQVPPRKSPKFDQSANNG